LYEKINKIQIEILKIDSFFTQFSVGSPDSAYGQQPTKKNPGILNQNAGISRKYLTCVA